MKIKRIIKLFLLFVFVPVFSVAQEKSILQQAIQKELEKAKQAQGDNSLVDQGYKMAKEMCLYRPSECVAETLFKAESEASGDILQAVVCNEKEKDECLTGLAFARGGIRYALEEAYWQGKPIKEVGGKISALVTEYGVQTKKDAEMAKKYFYDLLQDAYDDCDSGFSIDYGSASHRADQRQARERKANYCALEVAGLSAIAMLSQTAKEKNEAAEKVYELLEETYSSSAAGIVIPGCISALAILNTPKSYSLIEEFLTDESIPTTAGDVLHSVSLSGMARGVLRGANNLRGGDSRYLNRINESFQYIDTTEAHRQGHKSTSYPQGQYPQGNLLEDVGYMLGDLSRENKLAYNLSSKLVKKANQYAKDDTHAAGSIHYPLILGILDGARKHKSFFANVPSHELLNLFYKGDWWDINEGTQRRVHYKAHQFAKERGYKWKEPTKDPAKYERYVYNSRILNMGEMGDLVIAAVAMGELVVSLPSMATGLAGCVRALTYRSTWMKGGKQLLALQRKIQQRVTGSSARTASVSATQPAASTSSAVSKTASATQTAKKSVSSAKPSTQKVAAKPAPKPTSKPVSKPAGEAKPAPKGKQSVAATPAEGTSAAPTRAKIEGEITGPLNEKVQAAKVAGRQYAERSLMPKPSGEQVGHYVARSDNLVYVEAHPTDPAKAVFYYADDMGSVVTPQEVPMAQYEALMNSMSAAEKNMLARAGDLYSDAIGVARKEREYARLDDLARQIKDLRTNREDIIKARPHVGDDPTHFAQIRNIDNQIAALKKEATRTIKDMSQNGMGPEKTLAQIFEYELESVAASAGKASRAPLSYANRGGLMPKASGKPTGEFKPLSDNLVYVEAHPTDPATAVFYYADDMGSVVTPQEVPMAQYEALMNSMSAAEKNMLARAGDLYSDAIGVARKEREYARLDQMAEQLNNLRAQRQQIATSDTYTWGEDPFARIRQIDQQIAQIEGQSRMLIRDMASNKLGTEGALRSYFQMNLKNPAPAQVAKASGVKHWKYNERSLMPEVPKQAQETGLFELRSDGLVYMERHATDPTKAIFYYADDAGKVSPRELPIQEYLGFMDDLTMPQKANLQHAAQVYSKEISVARVNAEYDRLNALGNQLGKLRQYEAHLRAKSVGSADDFKKIKEVQKQITSLETEAKLTVREMVNNKIGTENYLLQILQYAQETERATAASTRAVFTVSTDAEKAHEQLASLATQMGKLEQKRISLAQQPFSQAIAKEIREIDEQIRLLETDKANAISQMVHQNMGQRRTLEFMFREWKDAV